MGDAPWPGGLATCEQSASPGTVASSIRALAGVEVEASFWPDDRDWQIYYTDGGTPLAMAPIDQVGRRVDDGSPVFAVGEERTLLDAAEELGLELRELIKNLDAIWLDYLMEPFA